MNPEDVLQAADQELERSDRVLRRARRRLRPPLTNLSTYPRPWVTPPELADYLECDPRTILRMITAGSLYAFKVGRSWRIPIEDAREAFPEHRRSA